MKIFLAHILLVALITSSFTMIKDPPQPKSNDDGTPPPGLPINHVLPILIVSGVLVGFYKYKLNTR